MVQDTQLSFVKLDTYWKHLEIKPASTILHASYYLEATIDYLLLKLQKYHYLYPGYVRRYA